jgi:NTP pyrophosphatase (non-canonical NTP hydrolase)
MSLDLMARRVHLIAKTKGFWDGDVTYDKLGNKLALVHSEVTETLEAIRKDQGSEKTVEEMADVIIRLVDVYQAMINTGQLEHSLDNILEKKIMKNMERPALHGNKF